LDHEGFSGKILPRAQEAFTGEGGGETPGGGAGGNSSFSGAPGRTMGARGKFTVFQMGWFRFGVPPPCGLTVLLLAGRFHGFG